MKIKIICGQLEIVPGRPDVNYQNIITAINAARQQQADILLLPEMALPGYLIGDVWEQQTFLDDCDYYCQEIIKASHDICIDFGRGQIIMKNEGGGYVGASEPRADGIVASW